MVASYAGGYVPQEEPRIAVAADGSLAAIQEASRITLVELPSGTAFAEVGADPDAVASDVAWLGAPARLLVLSRYDAHCAVHLLDPSGPHAVAELRLEPPVHLAAVVGASALVIGQAGAAVLAGSESHVIPYQFATRALPIAAGGGAAGQFVVAFSGSIEEWDPQSRMPKRRLRLPRAAAITAVGGSDRVVWMTTQQEPARIDVIPLVNRGQPKAHDLPEPIMRIAGHPRSDLVACVGALTGKLYIVDLDGRSKLRIVELDDMHRPDAIALIVGRMVGVIAAQAGRPIAIASLDGRDQSDPALAVPRGSWSHELDTPADSGAEELEAPSAADGATAGEGAVVASEDEPAPVSAPPVSAPPVSAPPVTAPVAAPPVTAPVTAPPVTAPPVTAPPVTAPPVTAPPRPAPPSAASSPIARFISAPPISAPSITPPPVSPAAAARSSPPAARPPTAAQALAAARPPTAAQALAAARAPAAPASPSARASSPSPSPATSASERFSAWREQVRQDQRPEPIAAAPPPPAGGLPAVHADARQTWRDEVVTWTRAVIAGTLIEHNPPAAPPIEALIARLELALHLQPALTLLYGAHLSGERGAAPVDVARVLDRQWAEALGRGELAERGAAVFHQSRVCLAPILQRVLDELPPLTGALVGAPGTSALLGPCLIIAGPDEPLASVAARCLSRVGGAVLAAHADLSPDLLLEARAYGAAPLIRPSQPPATAPTAAAIFVLDDADLADRLSLPRLA